MWGSEEVVDTRDAQPLIDSFTCQESHSLHVTTQSKWVHTKRSLAKWARDDIFKTRKEMKVRDLKRAFLNKTSLREISFPVLLSQNKSLCISKEIPIMGVGYETYWKVDSSLFSIKSEGCTLRFSW